VQAGFYNQNLLPGTMIRKGADGKWRLRTRVQPDRVQPSIDISEYGLWVRAVIENPEVQDDGRPVCTSSENITFGAMIDILRKRALLPSPLPLLLVP